MEDWAGLAGVPLIVALVEAVKRTFPELEARWWPVLALAWGVALNLGLAAALGRDWRTALVLGVVAGLAAAGLYSGTRTLAQG